MKHLISIFISFSLIFSSTTASYASNEKILNKNTDQTSLPPKQITNNFKDNILPLVKEYYSWEITETLDIYENIFPFTSDIYIDENWNIQRIEDHPEIIATQQTPENQEEKTPPSNSTKTDQPLTYEEKLKLITDEAEKYIYTYEKFHPEAYPDHKWCSIGYWTRANSCSEYITEKEAERRMRAILQSTVKRIEKNSPELSPKEAWAIVSLAYNCDFGYKYFLNNGFDATYNNKVCIKASWKVLDWLVKRRNHEAQNFREWREERLQEQRRKLLP